MKQRVLLIQGHPDAGHAHLCGALERAYGEGALAAGHEVRHIQVAGLHFPLLKRQDEWEHSDLPLGPYRGDDGYAGAVLQVVFARPQHQVNEAQYPRLCRHRSR
ncbi:NAD(P)H-dependent oxidoreductase [Massilia sp. CCM 9210]|uniref:hypothetical protein n=1 Tax=Massilia scottii TaxID=3057166 RepID=UPI002796AE8E|nr:hypothetical protein [Massilia sp. CCM 9210]MDQ1812350.1 NAD(P)H-dependent oxidoreductase [Massilia sp. CCM 9210]